MKNKQMKKKLGRPAIYTPEEARLRRNAKAKESYTNSTPEQKSWKTFSSYMSIALNEQFATPEEREAKKLWKTFSSYMSIALKQRFATPEEKEAMSKKTNEYTKKWRNTDKGKEWVKNYTHSLTPEGWSHYAFGHFKTSHNKLTKNGRIPLDSKYDLTPEWIFNCLKEQNFQCAETGIKFTFGTPDCPNKPSFDRIDNAKGYEKSNLRLVTAQTNVSRNDLSVEENILRQVLVVERIKRRNPELFKRLLSETESRYGYALI